MGSRKRKLKIMMLISYGVAILQCMWVPNTPEADEMKSIVNAGTAKNQR
jgi:hypothetical protein